MEPTKMALTRLNSMGSGAAAGRAELGGKVADMGAVSWVVCPRMSI